MPAAWKKLILSCLAVVLLAGLPWFLIQPEPIHTDYCAVCAAEHRTSTWVLRPTGRVLWTRESVDATPISTVLAAKRLVAAHAHRWIEPATVPNPLNPYAPPVRISLGFVNTPLVATLLGNVDDWADPQSARHVCEVVLAPEYSYLINHDLRFHKFARTTVLQHPIVGRGGSGGHRRGIADLGTHLGAIHTVVADQASSMPASTLSQTGALLRLSS